MIKRAIRLLEFGALLLFTAGNARAQNCASLKTKIIVSIAQRHLWYVDRGDTLLSAPVTVGMGREFSYAGKNFHFDTPRGCRTVQDKQDDPAWLVPAWAFYEYAALLAHQSGEKIAVVETEPGKKYPVGNSLIDYVLVHSDGTVGYVDHNGTFHPFEQGKYPRVVTKFDTDGAVLAETIFVPPQKSAQRLLKGALGPYKLALGDGYLIHGTNEMDADQIGQAVSHGCVRLDNESLGKLYAQVRPGTAVLIY